MSILSIRPKRKTKTCPTFIAPTGSPFRIAKLSLNPFTADSRVFPSVPDEPPSIEALHIWLCCILAHSSERDIPSTDDHRSKLWDWMSVM